MSSLPHTFVHPHPLSSSAKLVVTTSSRHSPGSGPVLVETVRGGVGVSSITFTFVAMEAVSGVVGVLESHSPFIKKRKQQHQGEMCGCKVVVAMLAWSH